jgi:glutamyl/glutaminyl-tRNA synthetase
MEQQPDNRSAMNSLPRFRRTRLAPTPSGYLHVGNVLSFVLTASLAEKTGAAILLRIDDLDRERVEREYVQDIFDTLRFLDIPWQEGPKNVDEYETRYSQVHRLDLYREALQQLVEEDAVFACTCSRMQVLNASPEGVYPGTCRDRNIPLDTPNASWRLKTGHEKELEVKTLSGSFIKATLPSNMRDFVVRKKDGFPAYQLASLVDDLHFNIGLIVRGEDLWPSTLAQLYLASVLKRDAFHECAFHHHPLLLSPEGHKLSKSAGSISIRHFREEGLAAADVYSSISKMLGLPEAGNRQELGERVGGGLRFEV